MEAIIRKSLISDIPKMTVIFDEARNSIKRLGIDQWQNGYPNVEIIESDIKRAYSHVIEMNGEIVATFAIIDDGEPTYDKIYDGEWLTGDSHDYIAIHRVAILISARSSGLSGKIIEYAENTAKAIGRSSIRIDTHTGNIVMRKMLEKNRFSHCGTIFLCDGAKRVAYEKTI